MAMTTLVYPSRSALRQVSSRRAWTATLPFATASRRSLATVIEKSDQDFGVPVVDFKPFWNGSEQRNEVGKAVVKAFKEVGFMYIKNHQIPQDKIDYAFKQVC